MELWVGPGWLEANFPAIAMCTQFYHHMVDYYTKPSIMGLHYTLLFSQVFSLRNLHALVKPEHNLVSVTEATVQRWIFFFCGVYVTS